MPPAKLLRPVCEMVSVTRPELPEPLAEPDIRIDSHLDGAAERSLADDALDGLTRPFKELPPKHFYDARGAELFDRICELPEYYPTRAERAILERSAAEIAELTGAVELVELGSGTAARSSATSRSTSPRAWSVNAPSRSPASTRGCASMA